MTALFARRRTATQAGPRQDGPRQDGPGPIELVPLARVSAADMTPLIEHERECWIRELAWGYSSTVELIARALERGHASGFAARRGRRVLAYAYLVMDADRGHLGSLHALPEAEGNQLGAALLERSLTLILRERSAIRLEAQFPYFGQEDLTPVFTAWGCRGHPRQYLLGPLAAALERLGPGDEPHPGRLRLVPFEPRHKEDVARIVHRSFLGSIDAEMSECYATRSGCRSFVDGVTCRDGCGRFEPRASRVAIAGGELAGVVLASRVAADVGHIVQISVAPEHQGRGLGRALLGAACRAMVERAMLRLSLSVSVANRRARSWYLSLGLAERKDFTAWVWQARPREARPGER